MQTFNGIFRGIALALALLAGAGTAAAETASDWVDLQDAKVRLVAMSQGLDDDGAATLGVQIELADGWKTYWREPGEAGLPPRLDWSGSDNLAEARLAYPAPHRFESFGMTSLGYAGAVIFPVKVRAADRDRRMVARVAVDFMVCERICVPIHADLALDLPPGDAQPSAHAAALARHAATVPTGAEAAGLRIEQVAVLDGRLRVEASAEAPFDAPDLFVEADGRVGYGKPDVMVDETGRRAVLSLPVSGELAGRRIVLTLVDGARALEQAWTLR
ncbi:MAG: protein-disulfide reductase DsbD family protein [Alphaproteobacteria bacterium]